MSWQTWVFILSVALIGYAYAGYPVLVWLLAKVRGRPVQRIAAPPRAVSVIVAAYNEASHIERRAKELIECLSRQAPESEVIIVSDGSTDGTDRVAREIGHPQIRVIQQPRNMGKAVALNTGVAAARNPIIIFADARQRWDPGAIFHILRNYADPAVGAVSGDLVLENHDGSLAGVGLYWKLEKLIRRCESRWRSSVQVSGSISSVRKELYEPMPPGTILDDVYWPLCVAMQGYRVIHESHALAFDRLPAKPKDEFRRKVRTLSGNLQLIKLNPSVLLPWRSPSWFALVNHKLLRLVVPWAMVVALVACAIAPEPVMRYALAGQLLGYLAGILAMASPAAGRNRILNAISSLLVLNFAAGAAWFVFVTGRTGQSWKKVSYATQGQAVSAGAATAGGAGQAA